MSRVANVIAGAYNSLLRPAELVRIHQSYQQTSVRGRLKQFWTLSVVYLLNLGLYALPLTLAGFGQQSAPSMPDWFSGLVFAGANQALWKFTYAFIQNSLSILGATVLTLATFHVGVVITRQSQGLLETSYAVIYSTSVYLAGIFSAVWYLSLHQGVGAARAFVVDIQKAFVYAVIDFFGANLGLPGGRPGSIDLTGLSGEGELVIMGLLILFVYYLYSLYLGARINHKAPRLYSVLAVGMVATSPVIYVSVIVIAYSTPVIPLL